MSACRVLSALLLLSLLAACGAAGEPEPVGIDVGGDARIGVTGTL